MKSFAGYWGTHQQKASFSPELLGENATSQLSFLMVDGHK